MNILVTGGLGNIGRYCLNELQTRGHTVTCLALDTRLNRRAAKPFASSIELIWGDIRNKNRVRDAITGQQAIIHLAGINKFSELDPREVQSINIDGSAMLLDQAIIQEEPPRFILGSTCELFGHTQALEPPRSTADPILSTNSYTESRLICEKMLRDSRIKSLILRLAHVPNLQNFKPGAEIFNSGLHNRIEVLHPHDASLAICNALECDHDQPLLIGGGESCQLIYGDYISRLLQAIGIDQLPAEAFSNADDCHDWYDTDMSQQLLNYQQHSFEDMLAELRAGTRARRLFASGRRKRLLQKSRQLDLDQA